jgi:hypothetical protein
MRLLKKTCSSIEICIIYRIKRNNVIARIYARLKMYGEWTENIPKYLLITDTR